MTRRNFRGLNGVGAGVDHEDKNDLSSNATPGPGSSRTSDATPDRDFSGSSDSTAFPESEDLDASAASSVTTGADTSIQVSLAVASQRGGGDESQTVSGRAVTTDTSLGGQRILTIDTAVKDRTVRAPVKVVLVVDNSFSMESKQAKVAAALADLVDTLDGEDVTFLLYTTTCSGMLGRYPTVLQNTVSVTLPDGTTRLSDPPAILANMPYLKHEHVPVAPPYNNGNQLQLGKGIPAATVKSQLQEAILALGTEGSDQEDGRCSLAYIQGSAGGEDLTTGLQPGDLITYLLISDEDVAPIHLGTTEWPTDKVLRVDPMAGWTDEVVTDVSQATYQKVMISLQLGYIEGTCHGARVDGVLVDSGTTSVHHQVFDCRASPALCTPAPTCPTAAQELLSEACRKAHVGPVKTCAVSRIYPLPSQVWTELQTAGLTDAVGAEEINVEKVPDACQTGGARPITFNSSVDSLVPVVPVGEVLTSSYLATFQNRFPTIEAICTSELHRVTPIVLANPVLLDTTNVSATPADLHAAAAAISGVTGYFFSMIINDPEENAKVANCAPQAHESMGTAYRQVAIHMGPDRGLVTSLCASDYRPAIAPMSKFVVDSLERSYLITTMPDLASVERLTIIRDGTEATVAIGRDVEIVGQRLTFAEGVLAAGDLIRIYLKS